MVHSERHRFRTIANASIVEEMRTIGHLHDGELCQRSSLACISGAFETRFEDVEHVIKVHAPVYTHPRIHSQNQLKCVSGCQGHRRPSAWVNTHVADAHP